MSYPSLQENYAAAVQAEMRKTIANFRPQTALTLGSYKSGTGARGPEGGRLAGLEIPIEKTSAVSGVSLDPYAGSNSFGRMTPPTVDKMFVGLTFQGITNEWEFFHETDARRGNLPLTSSEMKDKLVRTYLQHQNWYRIGDGTGALAVVASGGGGGSGTITCAYDATARGRSKGNLRLHASYSTSSSKRVEYESYTTSTDTKTATFYITAKANATQMTIVVTDAGTVVAGDIIVRKGTYKKVPYGHGTHFSSSSRMYQGVDTTGLPFLNSRRVNAGTVGINPTFIRTAKTAIQTRSNDVDAKNKRICHLTLGNYQDLAAYGYTLRKYNAEKGDANTTYGTPFVYEDEDTIFVQDADFEDAVIDFRDRKSYFEYRQLEMTQLSPNASRQVGDNLVGSTESYDNWVEAYNFAWDGRGDDGKGMAGQPNTSVYIDNLALPSVTQVGEGLTLI